MVREGLLEEGEGVEDWSWRGTGGASTDGKGRVLFPGRRHILKAMPKGSRSRPAHRVLSISISALSSWQSCSQGTFGNILGLSRLLQLLAPSDGGQGSCQIPTDVQDTIVRNCSA